MTITQKMLKIERLRTIILFYDGDKALLELSDSGLLKALGFTREQNGAVYSTVTGLLMAGKVLSSRRFVPAAAVSFQVLADVLKGVGWQRK